MSQTQWSDKLAGATIAEQLKTIDRLTAKYQAERQRREKLEALLAKPTHEMRLAVARSIGASIDETNHMVRADLAIEALRLDLFATQPEASNAETGGNP